MSTETNGSEESKLDLDELQRVKKEGNAQYGKKQYKSALTLYEKSLKSVNIDIYPLPTSGSLLNAAATEYYKQILNKIELNVSLKHDIRNEISKIFSNRAACHLNLKKYTECIHESNIALLYYPNNENALYRRAYSYEKLNKYTISLKNYQKLLQVNGKNKKALDGCNRVQKIITKKQDRVTIYKEAIDILKKYTTKETTVDYTDGKEDNQIVMNIGRVINQIYHTQEYHQQIIEELKFTHILYDILLSEKPHNFSINVQIDCIRALNATMKHVTSHQKFSQENQILVINAFECNPTNKKQNYIKILIEKSKAFLSKLINVFENKDNNKENECLIDKNEGLLIQLLCEYLTNIASNQYLFEKYSDDIFMHLVEYFKKLKYKYIKYKTQQKMAKWFKISKQKTSNGQEQKNNDDQDEDKEEEKTKSNIQTININNDKSNDKDDNTLIISDILVIILKHLSNTALRNSTDNYALLEKIRYTFFYQFLFSDFSKDLRIKNEILRYFVCCSGLKSVFDQVNDAKLSKLKTSYEQQIIEALTNPIVNALKTKQFTSSNMRLVKALRGLSIMLQSNHKLGCDIAAKEDVLNCIVEVATINQPKEDYKYTQSVNKTKKEEKKLDAIEENNDNKQNEDDEDEEVEVKYDSKGNKIDEIGYLGCEVLALSCSNSTIRDAIIKSNNQHLFAWILDTDDLMVRAYSANALSKFAAIDDDSRELALGGPNRCMYSCCAIIYYLLQNEDKNIINNKSQNDLENNKKLDIEKLFKQTDKDKDKTNDDDEYRNYKLPLMNLCVETISYLSLHLETKLGIIGNKNEILKLLVSISSTRYFLQNRSLRHGLLTIILNCSLSKDDVTRYMSEKEEQLAKLRKVVSKGLPKDPTKQDEIIQSRAGSKEKIKEIQKELIKENCIYLIYNIVKFTNQENKKVDNYIHDEIGLTEKDEIKLKQREEQARRDRYSWDPNKYSNETEKDKLARKKLSHLTTQKTKYRSFELEEKLQMKICQVLMMISSIYEFRGNLVQQKAIRLSMDLFFQNKHGVKTNSVEIRQMASVAVARICISVNPILLNINDVKPIIEVLLKLVSEAQHELYIYEALLALCNIASMNNDDIKIDIAKNKRGWSVLRNAFEDEHDLINAAILETWCNLCTAYQAGIIKLYKNRDTDVQIVTLFLQHDSRRIQRAAVSILAIATSIVYDDEDSDNDNNEPDISKGIAKEIAKNGGVLMLQCLLNIRQQTLIERFNENEDAAKNKELDKVIIERIRIVMANLERYGYNMRNIDKHGMKKDVMKEFQSYLPKK